MHKAQGPTRQSRSAATRAGTICATIFFVAIAACGGSSESPTATTTSTSTSSTTTSTTSTTTTTTTTSTTTTTTTTVPDQGLEARDEGTAITLFVLNASVLRDDLLDILNGLSDVETVDKLAIGTTGGGPVDVDSPDTVLVLDITSAWASRSHQEDGAWSITRLLSVLWNRDDGLFYTPYWTPGLYFVNSGTEYQCSGEFMVRMAATLASRSDWERECLID